MIYNLFCPFILCKMHRGAHKRGSNLHMTTSLVYPLLDTIVVMDAVRPTSPSGSASRKMSFSPVIRTTIFGPSSQICFGSSFSTHSVRFPLFQETQSHPLSQPIWMSIPSRGQNQRLNLTEAWHTLSGQQSWLSFESCDSLALVAKNYCALEQLWAERKFSRLQI